MKKTYAAARLLEHGPLTLGEFIEITGWCKGTCEWALGELISLGTVAAVEVRPRLNLYRLAQKAVGIREGVAD
jgi:hypothetical protein